MSGLADELLADLEGLSEGEEEYKSDDQASAQAGPSTSNGLKRKVAGSDDNMSEEEGDEEGRGGESTGVGLVLEGGVKPAEELDAEDVQQMDLGGVEDVRKIAKLYGSKRMSDILSVRHTVTPRSAECVLILRL